MRGKEIKTSGEIKKKKKKKNKGIVMKTLTMDFHLLQTW